MQSIIGRLVMLPFTVFYGIMIGMRNVMYQIGILKSSRFNLPVISVGNLSVGGAGKTPHVEYLTRLLRPYINVSILSRGYKRTSKGFRIVRPTDDVRMSGDEPLMFARKYHDVIVAVGERRDLAIPQLVGKHPEIQVILLDDAFQHLSVKPDVNILLTTYDDPFTRDYLLPTGRLREWRSSYMRADLIIVTKCPADLSEEEKISMIKEINPSKNQKIFFSYYDYDLPYSFYNSRQKIHLTEKTDVILISAIANTHYLSKYLDEVVGSIHYMDYEDHHLFSSQDIDYIIKVFKNRNTKNKIVLTTEKDAMRLSLFYDALQKNHIPVYILPAEVKFHFDGAKEFDAFIKDFLLDFRI